MMDQQLTKLFKERWKIITKVQEAEMRVSNLEQSWQETNAIFCLARDLMLLPARRDDSAEVVMLRWNKLKQRPG